MIEIVKRGSIKGGGRMIEIVKQDTFNGEVSDTTIKVDFIIVVAGRDLDEFKKKLENLIAEYHI